MLQTTFTCDQYADHVVMGTSLYAKTSCISLLLGFHYLKCLFFEFFAVFTMWWAYWSQDEVKVVGVE